MPSPMATNEKKRNRCMICGKFSSDQQPDYHACRDPRCIELVSAQLSKDIKRHNERLGR